MPKKNTLNGIRCPTAHTGKDSSVSVQVQCFEHSALYLACLAQYSLRALASPAFGGEDIDDLADVAEFLQHSPHGKLHTCAPQLLQGERPQQRRDCTVQPVDADLTVCPVVQRPPTAGFAVLHLFEHVFDDVLTVVGDNEFLKSAFRVVGNDKFFPQEGVGKPYQCLSVCLIGQARGLLSGGDLNADDLLEILAGPDFVTLLCH